MGLVGCVKEAASVLSPEGEAGGVARGDGDWDGDEGADERVAFLSWCGMGNP